MARANKYASVNFNHVYDKNISNSSSSSNTNNNPSKHPSSTSFYSTISSPNSPNNLYKSNLPSSSTRTHGRMLVLTRPTPKPISTIQTTPLTPLRKPTNPSSSSSKSRFKQGLNRNKTEKQKEVGASLGSPKPDKFVPPHLRSGFVGREERPGPEVFRGKETQIQWKSAQFKWMSSDDTEVITCTRTGSLMPHTRYFIEPQFSYTVPLELSLSLSRGSVAF
uniref:Uncharacterized protein n=1 Tax=Populus alba TaxID=43335 RepID=A0A4U5NPP1_POPAL|nr:hypothetical protein D5086_0000255470 [Populus alba]